MRKLLSRGRESVLLYAFPSKPFLTLNSLETPPFFSLPGFLQAQKEKQPQLSFTWNLSSQRTLKWNIIIFYILTEEDYVFTIGLFVDQTHAALKQVLVSGVRSHLLACQEIPRILHQLLQAKWGHGHTGLPFGPSHTATQMSPWLYLSPPDGFGANKTMGLYLRKDFWKCSNPKQGTEWCDQRVCGADAVRCQGPHRATQWTISHI